MNRRISASCTHYKQPGQLPLPENLRAAGYCAAGACWPAWTTYPQPRCPCLPRAVYPMWFQTGKTTDAAAWPSRALLFCGGQMWEACDQCTAWTCSPLAYSESGTLPGRPPAALFQMLSTWPAPYPASCCKKLGGARLLSPTAATQLPHAYPTHLSPGWPARLGWGHQAGSLAQQLLHLVKCSWYITGPGQLLLLASLPLQSICFSRPAAPGKNQR
jgi:hypothetical protein